MSTPAAAYQQRESGNRRNRSKYPRDKAGQIQPGSCVFFPNSRGTNLAVKKEHNPKQVHQAKRTCDRWSLQRYCREHLMHRSCIVPAGVGGRGVSRHISKVALTQSVILFRRSNFGQLV